MGDFLSFFPELTKGSTQVFTYMVWTWLLSGSLMYAFIKASAHVAASITADPMREREYAGHI